MLTAGEQRELCQIGQDLRDTDRGFAWRLTTLQRIAGGWAAPGRRAYLPVLGVLAAALLRLVATAGRLLAAAYAEGAVLIEPMTLIVLGDTARPGRQPGPEPDPSASPVRGRPQFDGPDLSQASRLPGGSDCGGARGSGRNAAGHAGTQAVAGQ